MSSLPIITNLTRVNITTPQSTTVTQISPQAIAIQQQDPAFAKVVNMTAECVETLPEFLALDPGTETVEEALMNEALLQTHLGCGIQIAEGLGAFCDWPA
jgi:hypothetical protein